MDRGAWQTSVHGVSKVLDSLATKQQQLVNLGVMILEDSSSHIY